MAECNKKEDQKAVLRILHMLLSSCGEVTDVKGEEEDGLHLSQLIDQSRREPRGTKRRQSSRERRGTQLRRNNVFDYRGGATTNWLLEVLRDCMLSHRWVAALRVLTTLVHCSPEHLGCTVLHCILELCTQLSLPMPDSLMLRLKKYGRVTEHEVAVECFMWRAVSSQPLDACRVALAPLPRIRLVGNRDDHRERLLARIYDGLASYAQYLDVRQTLEQTGDGSKKQHRDDLSTLMKSYARDALEKWDGLADVPGVWDVFIVKQVELLECAGDLDAAEDVLLKYARRRRLCLDDSSPTKVWPNALHLLYSFYEQHPRPNDDRKRVELLEELYSLVPSHPLMLTLYRERHADSSRGRDGVGILFDLLDYATWRDDVRPWRHLARRLRHCALPLCPDDSHPSPADIEPVRHAWCIRSDWWPSYHFATSSLPDPSSMLSEDTLTLIGYKASVAHFLLSDDNTYTQTALMLSERAIVKTKGMSQLKKVTRKWSTLPLG